MGLNATLKKAATTALEAAGDLRVTCVYTHVPEVSSAVTFDPVADTVDNTTTDYTFLAILASVTKAELDWLGIDAVTQKLIVDYAKLPVKPTQKDSVLIDGDVWQVRRVKGVPGESVHVIFLRRS